MSVFERSRGCSVKNVVMALLLQLQRVGAAGTQCSFS